MGSIPWYTATETEIDTATRIESKTPIGIDLIPKKEVIRLRERGTKTVHLFECQRIQIDNPASAPAWMSDKFWKHTIKKLVAEKLEELRLLPE